MHEGDFTLVIRSFEEFAAFVALVRGNDLNDPKLAAALAKLKHSTAALKAAETQAEGGQK